MQANSPELPRFSPQELRRLQLRSRKLASTDFLGSFRSAFRGTGLTFAELREYQPGDDIRTIDWKASARSHRPGAQRLFVRSYEEERALSIVSVLDISRSLSFGSKYRRSIELVALLAQLARASGDAFGLMTFSKEIESWIPPRTKRHQTENVLRELLQHSELSRGTNLAPALEELERRVKRRSVLFIVSDFFSSNFEAVLKRLSARHDVVCCLVEDPVEWTLPEAGLVRFSDAEGQGERVIDLSSAAVRTALLRKLTERREGVELLCQQAGADFFVMQQSPLQALRSFVLSRRRGTRA